MKHRRALIIEFGFAHLRIFLPVLGLVILLTIVLLMFGRKTIFQNRAGSNNVLVTIVPNDTTLPATVKVFIDPIGEQMVFARLVINFEKTKLKLVANPTFNSKFQNEIIKSSMAVANLTGKIELVAGINPPTMPVTTAQEFATLMFDKNTTSVTSSVNNVNFSVTESQIVALTEKALTINAVGAKIQTPPPANKTVSKAAIPATRQFHCNSKGDPSCYDVVNDGEININDWSSFSSNYGASVNPNATCAAAGQLACINCNNDSVINIFDFACFSKAYLKTF